MGLNTLSCMPAESCSRRNRTIPLGKGRHWPLFGPWGSSTDISMGNISCLKVTTGL